MAKGDDTRRRILAAAADQASVHGLAGVSLSDVAEAVGLSKSGVFKHFQAKEALQQALVEMVTEQFVERVWRPDEPLARGEARLRAVFERWLDWVDGDNAQGGCGLTAFAFELDDQPGPLRDWLRNQQLAWHKMLRAEFARVGEPPMSHEDADQAAFEMKGVVMGYNHSRRLLDDVRARTMIKRAFEALLKRTAAG